VGRVSRVRLKTRAASRLGGAAAEPVRRSDRARHVQLVAEIEMDVRPGSPVDELCWYWGPAGLGYALPIGTKIGRVEQGRAGFKIENRSPEQFYLFLSDIGKMNQSNRCVTIFSYLLVFSQTSMVWLMLTC